MAEVVLSSTDQRSIKGGGQTTNVTPTGQATQQQGPQTSTSEETRAAHTVTSTSTRAAVTTQNVRALTTGLEVSFRVYLRSTDPIEPGSASLGADCS